MVSPSNATDYARRLRAVIHLALHFVADPNKELPAKDFLQHLYNRNIPLPHEILL
jgi:hypothetical protein